MDCTLTVDMMRFDVLVALAEALGIRVRMVKRRIA
jgi:hypothetical protein